jgi:3-deoxy-D-manno-octulosonic-acid transferase
MIPPKTAAKLRPGHRRLLRGYDGLWRIAIPLLKHHPRLAAGYAQRRLSDAGACLPSVDLWWQAASAGEAYLAATLSEALGEALAEALGEAFSEAGCAHPVRLLVTTQTRQGFDILTRQAASLKRAQAPLSMWVRYLPFDRPALMRRAVAQARPRVAVLLETELWPGFMLALKEANVPLLVVNARMRDRSLRRYRLIAPLWRALGPRAVLALSPEDARRFGCLFGQRGVTTMANIKFDRVNAAAASPSRVLQTLFGRERPLVVFGSVRRGEEALIESLLGRLHRSHPHARLALFPRHMERLVHWRSALTRRGLPWVFRSRANAGHPVLTEGGVLLWDTFGELTSAYALACGAYVGGSLVPLGGQNFLEPLAQGIRPVIGPHWDNFAWVGREVLDSGLVHEVADVDGVFRRLAAAIEAPPDDGDKSEVRQALDAYLAPRRGGSAQAARLIRRYLT